MQISNDIYITKFYYAIKFIVESSQYINYNTEILSQVINAYYERRSITLRKNIEQIANLV